jgi:osmotically-inducible protein OsmY
MNFSRLPRAALLAAALAATTVLGACAPLVLGGVMVGGAMSYTDRRTPGTQVEDETIELKAINRVGSVSGGHVNITSFNRSVLLTGEVPTEAERVAVDKAVGQIENVRATTNELVVGFNSAMTARSNDTILTSKVKAGYLDAQDLQSNAIKVVSERGTVYLMGLVTEREAGRATDLARGVGGVTKVVRLFEVISEAELAKLQPQK